MWWICLVRFNVLGWFCDQNCNSSFSFFDEKRVGNCFLNDLLNRYILIIELKSRLLINGILL